LEYATLKHGLDSDGELFPTRSAEIHALANRALAACLRSQFGVWFHLAIILAMRANRAVRPAQTLKQFAGFILVGILLRQRNQVQIVDVKRRFALIGGFNVILHAINIGDISAFVKDIIPGFRVTRTGDWQEIQPLVSYFIVGMQNAGFRV